MPNFGKTRRQVVRLQSINPYLRAERRRVSRRSLDAAFDALWAIAEDTH